MSKILPSDFRAIPLEERLKLIEDLWNSIEADGSELPVPDWHRAELDRRLESLDSASTSSWDEVRRRILGEK